jgi:hypothetical protein
MWTEGGRGNVQSLVITDEDDCGATSVTRARRRNLSEKVLDLLNPGVLRLRRNEGLE